MRRVVGPILSLGLIVLAAQGAGAFAQAANPYAGAWKLKFGQTDQRVGIEGSVEVQGDAGTWKTTATGRNDPCVGRDAPIAVQKATAEQFVFRVMRSKALAGCQDFTVTMNRVDENNLQGELRNGWKLQMTRP